ncbi:MAG: NAD(P)/FAD-dependent oxidoreductase [Lachnospiraceae bacterium]|nr:NAD(P)/FAD-dependent oxidoreductase [Lachnospiraceae bacterium]
MKQYDVIIIGAGVCGAAIAREMARKQRRIAVLEAASDVCEGTSKANSGIVHAGHDALPGTLKAKLNVLGNKKMEALAEELDFPFKRNGSLVLCFHEEDRVRLEELLERGRKNGVEGLKILSPKQVWEMEPGISKNVVAALYAPTGGIVCPFGLNIALAENAAENGVDFYLNHRVTKIENRSDEEDKDNSCRRMYSVLTGEELFQAPIVINAAGVYADVLHNMVSKRKMEITPRRGEYCLMDKASGNLVKATVFQLPSQYGKGILVTPSVHGNLLVGPTAEDIPDKENTETTAVGLKKVMDTGALSVEGLDSRQIITSFAGLRAHITQYDSGVANASGDFVIEEVSDAPGFFDVAGIESPGLSCVPAISEYVAELVNAAYPAPDKTDFKEKRKGLPNVASASNEERQALIAENPAFANVICRCEMVTEGEIVAAIHRPLGATTLDGVKRRTRAGMGRCQSGFCSPKVLEILARERGVDQSEITKSGAASAILTGHTKDDAHVTFSKNGKEDTHE